MDRVLEAKLRLEAILIRPLGEAIANYIYAWGRYEGMMPLNDRIAYLDAIRLVLERHYATVMLSFQGRTLVAEPSLQDAALNMSMAERYRARAHAQAHWILRGIDRDLAASMATESKADDTNATDDKKPFSIGVSVRFRQAVANAWKKAKGRLKAMANVETQKPAEETTYEWVKQNEANSRVYKHWISLMDGLERPAHHQAHLDYSDNGIPVDQAYVVNGEHLMHPGDGSLGASLGNLINCRCGQRYTLLRSDGQRIELPIKFPTLPAKRRWRQGDQFGDPTPIRPTTLVTLNGRTRARVVLGDGRTQATMEQATPSTIVVRVGRNVIARAEARGADVTSITIAPGSEHQGVEQLIRDSVRHSASRRTAP